MCVLADDKETIKVELDSNRNELINSVERAEVVLRCLTKLIFDNKKDNENGSDNTSRNI